MDSFLVYFLSWHRYMATSGVDAKLKLWDLRTYKCLNEYRTASNGAGSLAFSQKKLLAASYRDVVEVCILCATKLDLVAFVLLWRTVSVHHSVWFSLDRYTRIYPTMTRHRLSYLVIFCIVVRMVRRLRLSPSVHTRMYSVLDTSEDSPLYSFRALVKRTSMRWKPIRIKRRNNANMPKWSNCLIK